MFKTLLNINKTNNSIQNIQTRNMHFQLDCKFSGTSTLQMSPQAYTEKLKGPANWWKWAIISSLNLILFLDKQNRNLHTITPSTSSSLWDAISLRCIIPLLKKRAFVPGFWIVTGRFCSKLNRQVKTFRHEYLKGKCNLQCQNCLNIYIDSPFISSFIHKYCNLAKLP